MWFWLLSSIAGSIIGSATDSWFRDTKLGVWFYAKMDSLYTWASKRYGIKKCLPMSEKEWLSSPNSANDLIVSNLVSEYSNNNELTETQLATIRTRFNTWEKDGREIDF